VANELDDVAAIPSSRPWAVGFSSDGVFQTLIELTNGTTWKPVRSPNPGGPTVDHALRGVAATSATDAWAVGSYDATPSLTLTLTAHWNGTAWKRVRSQNRGTTESQLLEVAATAPTDVWAAGFYRNDVADQTLIEHWNGIAWKRVGSRNPGGTSRFNGLEDVAAASSTDAWAVGNYDDGTGIETLIEHWNGTAWKQTTSPSPAATHNELSGVAATSSTDAWAVGSYLVGNMGQTLIEHWDGRSWTVVPSPNAGSRESVLTDVAATSPTDAWAVGSSFDGTMNHTLIEHWDGIAWTLVPSPDPGSFNVLQGVAATSPTDAWAVGSFDQSTLAMHWC
jgi:hypothetical protein